MNESLQRLSLKHLRELRDTAHILRQLMRSGEIGMNTEEWNVATNWLRETEAEIARLEYVRRICRNSVWQRIRKWFLKTLH